MQKPFLILPSLLAALLLIAALPAARAADSPDYTSPDFWLHAFAADDTVDYPIIFVHGIGGGFENWHETILPLSGGAHYEMRFNDEGDLVSNYDGRKPEFRNSIWNVSYYNDTPVREALNGDLTTYAARLAEAIAVIRRITGEDRVVLVTHSMGGLVARAAMTLDTETWNSVHRILTVASPHEGVGSSIGVVGQLRDLREGSDFIERLNAYWLQRIEAGYRAWGVVGAIDCPAGAAPATPEAGEMTDSGGIGFIQFHSAIPFGEWKAALGANFGKAVLETDHFGYRAAIRGEHNEILLSNEVYAAIRWAMSR